MTKGFHLCTVLWGKWHVNAFLSYALPTLLAPNNIPALAATRKGHYTIITTPADASVLEASPVLATLRNHTGVEIVVKRRSAFEGNFAEIHDQAWKTAGESARKANQWMAFAAPDVCWSDGGLSRVADAFARGKSSVYLFQHRVAFETFPGDLERFRTSPSQISISAPKLAGLALDHLAPLLCSYFRNGRNVPHHAEYVFFPVRNEGVILRSIVTQAWAYDPTRASFKKKPTTLTADNPEQLEFLTDPKEIVNVSLTPTRHQVEWYFENRRFTALSEAAVGNQYYGYAVEHLWRQPFPIHSGSISEVKWQSVKRRSDMHMAKAYLTTRIVSVLKTASIDGCRAAAAIASAALALKLMPTVKRAASLSIVFPSNRALQLDPQDFLLARENKSALRSLIRKHVLLGDLSQPDLHSIQRAAGDTLPVSRHSSLSVGNACVLREIGVSSGFPALRLFEIDKVLQ